jgi:hypothetical protein
MEWDKTRIGQSVQAIRKLYVPAEIEIGTRGVVRDVRRPGNAMVPAVQVEWQVPGSPLYWCAGYEVEIG